MPKRDCNCPLHLIVASLLSLTSNLLNNVKNVVVYAISSATESVMMTDAVKPFNLVEGLCIIQRL